MRNILLFAPFSAGRARFSLRPAWDARIDDLLRSDELSGLVISKPLQYVICFGNQITEGDSWVIAQCLCERIREGTVTGDTMSILVRELIFGACLEQYRQIRTSCPFTKLRIAPRV